MCTSAAMRETFGDIAQAIVLLATNRNITGEVLQTDSGAHLTA
jgi:hypothetical protein